MIVRAGSLLLILATLALAGCAGLTELGSADAIGRSEVVLMGRIELDPPLTPGEQRLTGIGTGRYRNRLAVVIGERYREVRDLGLSDLGDVAVVDIGSDFAIKVPRRDTLIFSGASVLMDIESSGRVVYLYLPGGVQFRTRADDGILYLGTLRFHRDDYNDITSVDVADDYPGAAQAFRKKFGKDPAARRVEFEKR